MISIFTTLSDETSAVLSLPFSFLVGWAVWKSAHERKIGAGIAVLSGALIFGGLGLSIGFFGPLVFTPDANQGPMLGVFITGPLGCLVGTIGGTFNGRVKERVMMCKIPHDKAPLSDVIFPADLSFRLLQRIYL